ncbi:methyltransferase domain-containing protein [bacterium]|nr:methyltransferase domain-containing protein [bacterium]
MREFIKRLISQRLSPHLSRVYYKFRGFFLHGNNVECPVCGAHLRRFIHRGLDFFCRCGAGRRHRLLLLYLRRETELFQEPARVLQVGALLPEHRIFHSMPNLDYQNLDLNRTYADRNDDLTALPDPSESLDVIICFHVLEHIPDDRKAMREMHRVLKSDGWALIQVPHYPQRGATYEDFSIVSRAERKKHFGQWDHVRVYGSDFQERLEESGFTVRFIDYAAELSPAEIELYGVKNTVGFHLCTKSDAEVNR